MYRAQVHFSCWVPWPLLSLLTVSLVTYPPHSEEEFFSIDLPVLNKKTMHDALESLIQGDTLAGGDAYRCDKCNAKVDTYKRACIKRLPNTMAFVLKRFELDYETWQTVSGANGPSELDACENKQLCCLLCDSALLS